MTTTDPSDDVSPGTASFGERLVYVMPEEAILAISREELSLVDLWWTLWRRKWSIVLITSLFSVLSIVYALMATEWYKATVLLAPASESSSQGLSGALGGLVSLTGVSIGGNSDVEALAVLESRGFAASFIEDRGLLQKFFADEWDPESNDWISSDPEDRPDIRDGVKFFDEKVRNVAKDDDTGLVTLTIEWTDPILAAEWANLLVRRLNNRMRQEALKDAETNVAYLKAELGKTSVVTLQQSIGRLMESELQKLMLARGNEEFVFRVIDRAEVPKLRSRPRRTLIVILATIIGGVVSGLTVLFQESRAGKPSGAGPTRE